MEHGPARGCESNTRGDRDGRRPVSTSEASSWTIFAHSQSSLPEHRQRPELDDLHCTLGLTLRARVLSPHKKQTRAHPASEERSRTSLADLLRTYPARPLSPHASASHITTRDGSGGAL